jgi:hypothetical protein
VFQYGSVSVGTAEETPREGALRVPVSSRSSTSAPVLGADCAGEAVALVCEQVAPGHGFTAVWSGPERLEIVAAAVTRGGADR